MTALPGPSALLAALTVAGLPTDQFLFAGFLPPKQAARRSRIAELRAIPATIVLFETGPRLAATLADLAAGLGRRDAAVCRELTKLHEEIRRGDLSTLAQGAEAGESRGEIVLVIGPPAASEQPSAADAEALLREALARSSLKDAVAEIAEATGLPRRQLYQQALELTKQPNQTSAKDRTMRRPASLRSAPHSPNRRRARSGWRRSGSACQRKAVPRFFSLPRPTALWRGAGKHRSAKSTSSHAAVTTWCSLRSSTRPLEDAAEAVTDATSSASSRPPSSGSRTTREMLTARSAST